MRLLTLAAALSVVFGGPWCAGGCAQRTAATTVAARSSSPRVALGPAALQRPAATLFGVLEDNVLKRQQRFELSEDTSYGWRIKLPCRGPTLFKETLRLPAPGDWSFGPTPIKHVTISEDRTTAITVDYSGCFDGWIQNVWTIAANDPPGLYVLTVEIEGFAPQTFRGLFVRPDREEAAQPSPRP